MPTAAENRTWNDETEATRATMLRTLAVAYGQPATCEECGKPIGVDSPRLWACDDRCYGRVLGIDEKG